jgi:hypothetical protein
LKPFVTKRTKAINQMKQSRAPFEADYRLSSGGDRGISALEARMYFDRGANQK